MSKKVNGKARCVAYIRVSTNKEDQKQSIENQEILAKDFVKRHGIGEIVDIYRDIAVSASKMQLMERPAFQKLMEDARNGAFDTVIFKSLTRFARNNVDAQQVQSKLINDLKIRIIAIEDGYDSSKDGQDMLFKFQSLMGEFQARVIASSVRAGLLGKASRGEHIGQVPFGFQKNGKTRKLEINEEEAEIVREVFDLFVNQEIGTVKLAERLNDEGKYKTPRGKNKVRPWTNQTVKQTLRNPNYIGTKIYNKTTKEKHIVIDGDTGDEKTVYREILNPEEDWIIRYDAHPALIDKETFHKAQLMLDENSINMSTPRSYHPLSGGTLKCGHCGSNMICQFKNGGKYRYYESSNYHNFGRKVCTVNTIPARKLESKVLEIMKEQVKQYLKQESLNKKVGTKEVDESKRIRTEIKEKQIEQKSINAKRKRMFNEYDEKGLWSEQEYEQLMRELKLKLDKLETEIDNLERELINEEQSASKKVRNEKRLKQFLKDVTIDNPELLREFFRATIKVAYYHEVEGEEIGEIAIEPIFKIEMANEESETVGNLDK